MSHFGQVYEKFTTQLVTKHDLERIHYQQLTRETKKWILFAKELLGGDIFQKVGKQRYRDRKGGMKFLDVHPSILYPLDQHLKWKIYPDITGATGQFGILFFLRSCDPCDSD